MRCTRCDEIAIPASVGWTQEGRLVFGWCLACMEDRGCSLLDDSPTLGDPESLAPDRPALRSPAEARVFIAQGLHLQSQAWGESGLNLTVGPEQTWVGGSRSSYEPGLTDAIGGDWSVTSEWSTGANGTWLSSPQPLIFPMGASPIPTQPGVGAGSGGASASANTRRTSDAASRRERLRAGVGQAQATIPAWIQAGAQDPLTAMERLGKVRKLAVLMEVWALVLCAMAVMSLILRGGEFRSTTVNGSPLILFLGGIAMGCTGFVFWVVARGAHTAPQHAWFTTTRHSYSHGHDHDYNHGVSSTNPGGHHPGTDGPGSSAASPDRTEPEAGGPGNGNGNGPGNGNGIEKNHPDSGKSYKTWT